MSDVVEFDWPVARDGYRWVQSEVHEKKGERPHPLDALSPKSATQWVLTDGLPDGAASAYRFYLPLERETGLYRRFIAVDPADREAIRGFANSFGMLGIGRLSTARVVKHGMRLLPSPVETWADWKDEIVRMRHAVRVWDKVQKRDSAELSEQLQEIAPVAGSSRAPTSGP